jgi:hypothetical protein
VSEYLEQLINRIDGANDQSTLMPPNLHIWERDAATPNREWEGAEFDPFDESGVHSEDPLTPAPAAVCADQCAQKAGTNDQLTTSDRLIVNGYHQMSTSKPPRHNEKRTERSNADSLRKNGPTQTYQLPAQQQLEHSEPSEKLQIKSDAGPRTPEPSSTWISHPLTTPNESSPNIQLLVKHNVNTSKPRILQQTTLDKDEQKSGPADPVERETPVSEPTLKQKFPNFDRDQNREPQQKISLQPQVEDFWHRKPNVRQNSRQPRVHIGRLTVEIVNAPPDPMPKVSEPVRKAPQTSQPSHPMRLPSKLRFGLGQM